MEDWQAKLSKGFGITPRRDLSKEATAPYNFIPLPDKAVPAPVQEMVTASSATQKDEKFAEGFKRYVAEQGKLSGYIDYTIETLTPTYIGDKGNFFAPNGRPVIPGSTIRGLLKNTLKIISCGTMRAENNEDISSKHLYFRGLASKCKEFREYYTKKTTKNITITKDGKAENLLVSKAEPGFLILENNNYYICPAKKYVKEYSPDISAEEPGIKWDNEGVECHTGKMMGKKHYYRISNPNWESKIPVSKVAIAEYREDKTRKGYNLLDHMEGNGSKYKFLKGQHFTKIVPCFYFAEDNEVKHFGHGKYYRIPYERAIEEHIPMAVQAETVDFADEIFGRKEYWASRVAVEDGEEVTRAKSLASSLSHNLMSPNPTSFQLYLEQKGNKKLHWDNASNLRGYKMYWHKAIKKDGWQFAAAQDTNVKGTLPITPIDAGAQFAGRIRFNHLSEIELGALLAVLQLSDVGCFKLGMGKPLGMGSVKITYSLSIKNEHKRYEELFAKNAWQTGIEQSSAEKYIAVFEKYMDKETNSLKMKEQRMKILETLKIMMAWDNTNNAQWDEITKYMPIGNKKDTRYLDRLVLPTPQEVVGKK